MSYKYTATEVRQIAQEAAQTAFADGYTAATLDSAAALGAEVAELEKRATEAGPWLLAAGLLVGLGLGALLVALGGLA